MADESNKTYLADDYYYYYYYEYNPSRFADELIVLLLVK